MAGRSAPSLRPLERMPVIAAPDRGVRHRLDWIARKLLRGEHLNDEEIEWLVSHHSAFLGLASQPAA